MPETRRSYDTVAQRYAAEFRSELDHKPLDRALLDVLAELAHDGPVADIGGGPGHVAAYLSRRGVPAFVVDLSPRMCEVARRTAAAPAVVGDMKAVPLATSSVAAIVCLYAVIHLDVAERASAYTEFARLLRPGGHLLVSFHVSDDETAPGSERRLGQWWGHDVDLVFRFLDPDEELAAVQAVGFEFLARMDRRPNPEIEHASRRSYLLLRRP